MSNKQTRRRVFQQDRLQHQLEIQSQQIERVFSRHELTAHVAGGVVQPRQVSFDLQTPLKIGVEKLWALKDELITTLRATDVQLSKENGQWKLHVVKQSEPPVSLLDLLPLVENVPPVTAVLGLAENGSPVLLTFSPVESSHVLLCGKPDCGKTTLLRTVAISLAMSSKQAQTQLLIISPETAESTAYTTLEPLNYLPHLLTPVIYSPADAAQAITFLVNEMNYRLEQKTCTPTIVILIENIDALLDAEGQPVAEAIIRLAQRGTKAGIHLILSTRHPQAQSLPSLLRANLPVRIVGQVLDANEAQVATGMAGSQAEYLLGGGDFLAVTSAGATHFQAAYIGDYDLHMIIEDLHRPRTRVLLAQPFNGQLMVSKEEEGIQKFVFDGDQVEFNKE